MMALSMVALGAHAFCPASTLGGRHLTTRHSRPRYHVLAVAPTLPDEEELYTMLMASPALLISLCHTYAQDTACLASQYEPPAVCQELLAPNGGRGAPLAPESEWLFAPDWEPIRRAGYRAA